MKIAFIVGSFPALSETFILNQITGLIDRGHEVYIFAKNPRKESKVHPDIEKYQILEKTYYCSPPENKFLRISKAPFVFIRCFLKSPCKTIRSLNFLKYGKEAFSLKLLFSLEKFIDRDFDIITCHFGPNGILGTQLKDIGVNGKVITTFHAYDLTTFVREKGENVYLFLFTKGDFFLSISDYWLKKITSLGCNPQKLAVHRMGIDTKKFKLEEEKNNKKEKVKILTVGRLVEKKGHKYMIKALSKIVEKNKNIEYIIAGDGSLSLELKKLTKKFNVEKYTTFLGGVNQKEVRALYQEADIFALHSITTETGDQEGIPVVLMEASAAKLPIISTYHTGIPEIVLNNKSGFLVEEKDIGGIMKKLEYLIEHPEKREEMGRMGRKYVEEKYDINKLNDKLVEIYKNCLENEN